MNAKRGPEQYQPINSYLAHDAETGVLRAWNKMKRTPKTGRVSKYWDSSVAALCVEVLRGYSPLRPK